LVRDLKDKPVLNRTKNHVVEIVGPAGSGKSTLAIELSKIDNRAILYPAPNFHQIRKSPFFAINCLRNIPNFVSFLLAEKSTRPSLRQIVWMVTLTGWHQALRRSKAAGKILVLDQGPIFLMTDLSEFGPDCFRSEYMQKWWVDTYKQWANTIDLVVWLDAPTSVLINRINSRTKQHIVKNKPPNEISKFQSMSRQALCQTMLKFLDINDSLKILNFDTSQISPSFIAPRIFSALGLEEEIQTSDLHEELSW
jgi:cytidylate kinase